MNGIWIRLAKLEYRAPLQEPQIMLGGFFLKKSRCARKSACRYHHKPETLAKTSNDIEIMSPLKGWRCKALPIAGSGITFEKGIESLNNMYWYISKYPGIFASNFEGRYTNPSAARKSYVVRASRTHWAVKINFDFWISLKMSHLTYPERRPIEVKPVLTSLK